MAVIFAGGMIGAVAGRAALALTGKVAVPVVAAASGPVGMSVGVIVSTISGSLIVSNIVAEHRVRQSLKRAPPPPPPPPPSFATELGFWFSENMFEAVVAMGLLAMTFAAFIHFVVSRRADRTRAHENALLLELLGQGSDENSDDGACVHADDTNALALVPTGKETNNTAAMRVLAAVAREVKSVKKELVETRESSVTRDTQNLAAIAALQKSVSERDAEVNKLTRELNEVRAYSSSRSRTNSVDRHGSSDADSFWGARRGSSVERRSVERPGSVDRGMHPWGRTSSDQPTLHGADPNAPWVYSRGGSTERGSEAETASCFSLSSEEGGASRPEPHMSPSTKARLSRAGLLDSDPPKRDKEADDALNFILAFEAPSTSKPVRTSRPKPVRSQIGR